MSTKGKKKRKQGVVSVQRDGEASGGEAKSKTGSFSSQNKEMLQNYWKRNINLTLSLLAVWFVVGYILSIILAPWLNNFTFLGAPLGFWMAQNGAIYVFVLLIIIYAVRMNSLDEEFGVGEGKG